MELIVLDKESPGDGRPPVVDRLRAAHDKYAAVARQPGVVARFRARLGRGPLARLGDRLARAVRGSGASGATRGGGSTGSPRNCGDDATFGDEQESAGATHGSGDGTVK